MCARLNTVCLYVYCMDYYPNEAVLYVMICDGEVIRCVVGIYKITKQILFHAYLLKPTAMHREIPL